MSRVPPAMKGFEVERADAWWIECQRCKDVELVYGANLADEAVLWAAEHQRECAAKAGADAYYAPSRRDRRA